VGARCTGIAGGDGMNNIWLVWMLLALALDAGVWLGERPR
jgi:hypothetical protein